MDVFWTLPPVTRTLTAAAVIVSALVHTRLVNIQDYTWIYQRVFPMDLKMFPQLWRLVTPFLITKPKFAIVMDPYFLYQYGSGLERESSRFSHSADFFVYVVFVMVTIIATAGFYLKSYIFMQSLILAFAYTYAQDNPNRQVSFFIINFEAKFLPLATLFMTAILESPDAALTQATGLLAAHLYDFLTRIWPAFGGGRNWITTPGFVKRWFGVRPGVAQARSYGFAMPGRVAEPETEARTSGRAGGAWNNLGPGRRLGGE
ncbi:DER1-domain-containing protein [Delitschia confertaspora ATCC 74209]|uniref:Derlin n=1 Tax=Delitschia confertaspora ATCC 74209 TaxID=1513339 RepID=A0A9P4JVH4_9PLEO|nr:DER1-domain-containing protein [Delitschia confertaspora ATCC 74209]